MQVMNQGCVHTMDNRAKKQFEIGFLGIKYVPISLVFSSHEPKCFRRFFLLFAVCDVRESGYSSYGHLTQGRCSRNHSQNVFARNEQNTKQNNYSSSS